MPFVSPHLSEDEKRNLNIIKENLLIIPGMETGRKPSGKFEIDFSIFEEKDFPSLTISEINKFFSDFKSCFSMADFFPFCKLFSSLFLCGDYPFLLGGKISGSHDYLTSFAEKSCPITLLSGRIIFSNLITLVFSLFEARSCIIPEISLIKANEREFYVLLPGNISSKGEKHFEELNKWLLEETSGLCGFSWYGTDVPLEQIEDLPVMLFKIQETLRRKSLNRFHDFLEKGRNVFFVDFGNGICPSCNRRSSSEKICSSCERERDLSLKYSSGLDISPLIEGEEIIDILQKGRMDMFFSDNSSAVTIPAFYSSEDISSIVNLSCGKKRLFFAEIEILESDINIIFQNIYIKHFFSDLFSFIKSEHFAREFCHDCHNKEKCGNSLKCISCFNISSSFLWAVGPWDKILFFIKFFISLLPYGFQVRGKLKLFSSGDSLPSIIKQNSSLLSPEKLWNIDNLEIFDCNIDKDKFTELLNFADLLSSSIEKEEIKSEFIYYLFQCKPLIEAYFNKDDNKGLKFLPLMAGAIKKMVLSQDLRGKLTGLLEIDKKKSLLPYISFIINYLDVKLCVI